MVERAPEARSTHIHQFEAAMFLSWFGYSKKKLARELATLLREIDASVNAIYVPEDDTVVLSRSDDENYASQVFLGNIYLRARNLPKKERRLYLGQFLSDALTTDSYTEDELIAALSLRVRTRYELAVRDDLIAAGRTDEDTPEETGWLVAGEHDPLLELVLDGQQSVRPVSAKELEDVSVTVDEGFRIATASLVRATDYDQWTSAGDGVWVSSYQDDYDFARVVALGEDAVLPAPSVIAFAPSHSVCVVMDSAVEGALERGVDAGEQLAMDHRPFSQVLWARNEVGGWREWRPDEATAAQQGVVQLQTIKELLAQYDEQKERLQRKLGSEEIFVATYLAVDGGEGVDSMCTYTMDVPTYLPKANRVSIVDLDRQEDARFLGTLSWTGFVDAIGEDALVEIDTCPPRFALLEPLNAARRATLTAALDGQM